MVHTHIVREAARDARPTAGEEFLEPHWTYRPC